MTAIEQTLRGLDNWYNDTEGGNEKHSLLSKLALLELCGWLEERQDDLVFSAAGLLGLEADWTKKEVIGINHGFHYEDHLRRMMCKLVGEAAVLHIEEVHEIDYPGKLSELKGHLTILRNARGVLAHTHNSSTIRRQVTINAPSWCINQHRIISKLMDNFQDSTFKAFERTIKRP